LKAPIYLKAPIQRAAIHRAAVVALLIFLAGCSDIGVPPSPTVAIRTVEVTDSPTLTPFPTRPTLTPLPSWTPTMPPPTRTAPASVTPLPSDTPRPPTATTVSGGNAAGIAVVVVATPNEFGGSTFTLTEALINAELARLFDADPIRDYTLAPRVTLAEGLLTLSMPITQAEGRNVITTSLTINLSLLDGALVTRPTLLTPLEGGVTTVQVKRGEALLQRVIDTLVRDSAGAETFTINYAVVRSDGITITIVRR
jgi:hypothetical protein